MVCFIDKEPSSLFGRSVFCTQVDELTNAKANIDRMYKLKRWHNTGGIMILGYEMFRNLTSGKHIKKESLKEKFKEYLLDPGKSAVYVITGAHTRAHN